MRMFESVLASMPPNRHLMVSDLELPDDITLAPYVWTEPESLTMRSDSVLSGSLDEDVGTTSTDSSIALSRAMTDSEIDYTMYRRLKSRSFSDPWENLRAALDAFPPDHLASLYSFQSSSTNITDTPEESTYTRVDRRNEELALKMERFFAEECRAFSPDDPGLLVLEKALLDVDIAKIDSELDSTYHILYITTMTAFSVKYCFVDIFVDIPKVHQRIKPVTKSL